MNRVPVIVWNPAYLEELEPVDPATFISGDSQIVTAPASEDGDVAEEVVEEPDDEDLSPAMKVCMTSLGDYLRESNPSRTRVQNLVNHQRSLMMSLKLMYGTQGKLLSRSSGYSPTQPGKGCWTGLITKCGTCFDSCRNELIKEPTMIQILD